MYDIVHVDYAQDINTWSCLCPGSPLMCKELRGSLIWVLIHKRERG